MTKKRFIKLLMADGIPRNEAVKTCDVIRFTEESYESFYTGWRQFLKLKMCGDEQ